MREELKPLEYPVAPKIDGCSDEEARRSVHEYLERVEFVVTENRRRADLALRRMKICITFHAFLNPWGGLEYIQTHHFRWCPHRYWFDEPRLYAKDSQ